MLESLRSWQTEAEQGAAQAAPVPFGEGVEDRRRSERLRVTGGEVFLFLEGDQRYRFRLRDLCCLGISGLTDAPLRVGESVVVQIEEMLMPAAEVIWTQRAMAGLAFINPLPLARVKRLADRHAAGAAWSPAMRANSDLHGWWTDVDAQRKGRRPRPVADR